MAYFRRYETIHVIKLDNFSINIVDILINFLPVIGISSSINDLFGCIIEDDGFNLNRTQFRLS
jgi:hypothetical protein